MRLKSSPRRWPPRGWPALAALASLLPLPAMAYIDPGSGSMILQSLLAAIAMAAGAGAVFFARIKSFFSRRKDEGKDEAPPDDQP